MHDERNKNALHKETRANTSCFTMMTTTTKQKKTRLNKNPQLTEDVVANTRIQFQHDDELLHTVRTPFFLFFSNTRETNEVFCISFCSL